MKKILTVCSFILLFSQAQVTASRLSIDNTALILIHPAKDYAKVNCNVRWDKAWKNNLNCDAVWLFAKYRQPEGAWKHLTLLNSSKNDFNYLDQTPEYFSCGDNTALGMWTPNTRKGAFLFRTAGTGNVISDDVRLAWDYKADGLSATDLRKTEIRVFGIEMVYVPEDKYYVGDPRGADGPDNTFFTYPDKGPYLIDSEKAIPVEEKAGSFFCEQDNPMSRDNTPFTIPSEFPKGYKAFWCMKYELSSQQYVDMLNTLSRKQQAARVTSDISGDEVKEYHVMTHSEKEVLRQSICCPKKGNGKTEPIKFHTYAPARACNYISWADLEAYADWAALRPITELEYEKACRGPEIPRPEEYAWGTEDPARVNSFDGADGSGDEKKVPEQGIVNCCFHGGIAPFEIAAGKKIPDNPGFEGPCSIGLFENTQHQGVPKRLNDGASYYGIMELSGNLWERCVTIGHPKGRSFQGSYGDGELDAKGYANVDDWPGREGAGAGNRGGVWSSPAGKYLLVSLRFAANNPRSNPGKNSGIRVGF